MDIQKAFESLKDNFNRRKNGDIITVRDPDTGLEREIDLVEVDKSRYIIETRDNGNKAIKLANESVSSNRMIIYALIFILIIVVIFLIYVSGKYSIEGVWVSENTMERYYISHDRIWNTITIADKSDKITLDISTDENSAVLKNKSGTVATEVDGRIDWTGAGFDKETWTKEIIVDDLF